VAFDGNGNVGALVDAANSSLVARYEYGPFGEVVRATGAMAKANPFRFSTKYQDEETDLLYYGYRYYSASTGRWTSGDPIQERGHRLLVKERGSRSVKREDGNPYAFVLNAPTMFADMDGRSFTIHIGLKPCGNVVTRAIDPEEDPSWWTATHEWISGILYPHVFLILADGTRLTHGGAATGEDHRTASRYIIWIPKCKSCEEFTSCVKKDWPDGVGYTWYWNNCGRVVLGRVSSCGGSIDSWPD
jgi:RHS repeat-associated protein